MKARFAIALLAIATLCASALAQDNTAESWRKKGQELERIGSWQGAVDAYDTAIELSKENVTAAQAYEGKGASLFKLGKYNDAVKS